MDTSETKGNWNEQKGELKQKFLRLMNNNLLFTENKNEALLEKLQLKLGKTREECERIIAAL